MPSDIRQVVEVLESEYGIDVALSQEECSEIFFWLGAVCGRHWRENTAPNSKAVLAKLRAINRARSLLMELSRTRMTGFLRADEARDEAMGLLSEKLVQIKSRETLAPQSQFFEEIYKSMKILGKASLLSICALKAARKSAGRRTLDWHDSFAALLFGIAEVKAIPIRLSAARDGKDRVNAFLRMAELFEQFLPRHCHAGSVETRIQRLRRSRALLLKERS